MELPKQENQLMYLSLQLRWDIVMITCIISLDVDY